MSQRGLDMDQASYRAWQAGLSAEQQAKDKANNEAQERLLLDYVLVMGWMRLRTLEAEERIAQSEAVHHEELLAGSQDAHSRKSQPLRRAVGTGAES